MAEPEKQQMGDGSDNYGQAAKQVAKAAGRAGQEAAKQATANAATATVKAGVRQGSVGDCSRNSGRRSVGSGSFRSVVFEAFAV